MLDVVLSILALVAGGLTLELFAASSPPPGYQDYRGFRLGTETHEAPEEFQCGNPS